MRATHEPSPDALPPAARYDRLAGVYACLERCAFGNVLQKARAAYLDRIPSGAQVLVLGEGDGRFLRALLAARPDAKVTVVEASPAMLFLARSRMDSGPDAASVAWIEADLRRYRPDPRTFDAVVAQFVLDQFDRAERERWLTRYALALRVGGAWLHADFAIPERGWRAWRGRWWLASLYAFFRATTGIAATRLDPIEPSLRAVGLEPVARSTWSHGLVEAAVYEAACHEPGQASGSTLL